MSLVKGAREVAKTLAYKTKVMQNPSPAIDLIKQQPVKIVAQRVTHCDGGNLSLGHPRVYINLDHGVKTCGYCGQTFKQDASHHHH